MIKLPKCREDQLDIVWAVIRHENERWMTICSGVTSKKFRMLGLSPMGVVRQTGWSKSTIYRLLDELLKRGQVTRRWNHAHQSFWSSHYNTQDEHPVIFTSHEYDDIPF